MPSIAELSRSLLAAGHGLGQSSRAFEAARNELMSPPFASRPDITLDEFGLQMEREESSKHKRLLYEIRKARDRFESGREVRVRFAAKRQRLVLAREASAMEFEDALPKSVQLQEELRDLVEE